MAAMKRHFWENAAITGVVFVTVMLIVYGTQFAWQVAHSGYAEHRALAERNKKLVEENGTLTTGWEKHRHTIATTDPVFSNIVQLLQAFSEFRNHLQGEPCVVRITAPPESLELASAIAQLQIATSNCFTFGPDGNVDVNPDLEKEAKDGMINDAIVFHANRDDKAASELYMRLASQIKLRRSYQLPAKPVYQIRPELNNMHAIWLQFGFNVQWNSERYQVGKR
jgi:hypothetical protein